MVETETKGRVKFLNLNSIMIGSGEPEALAAFYERVLGKAADMSDAVQGFWSWQVGSANFSVMQHSEVKGRAKEPARLIFNLETSQVKEEFERIKAAAGATVIREPYELGGGWIATLADPDGNYFQLVTPT